MRRAHALARGSDPATSHEAARGAETRGKAPAQRELCLAAVQRAPGQTAAEIAETAGLERHVPSRRLPELRTMGLVESRDPRACAVQGTKALTWWPVSIAAKYRQMDLI